MQVDLFSDLSETRSPCHSICGSSLFPVDPLEGDSTCSSDPESVGSQNTSTPEPASPGGHRHIRFLNQSNHDSADGWILTPPPCFTAKQKHSCNVDASPLENLLIEHPSMSVYTSLECEGGGGGPGLDAGDMDVELGAEVTASCHGDEKQLAHQPPRRARAVAARAGLIAQIENIKVAQRQQTRWASRKLSRKLTNKENKVREHGALGRQQGRRARIQRPSGCMSGRMGQRKL